MSATKKVKVGVLASGSGTNLQAIIDACEKESISAEVAVVLSDKEDAYALKRAEKHKIPHFFVNPKNFSSRENYNKELIRILSEHEIDLVILAGFMRLMSSVFIQAFQNRVMNIHPALLPSFPGTHGVRDALEYGVKVSGVTVHFADEGLDTGPIILQEAIPVLENDTEETLHNRIHQAEYRLYPKAIKLFSEGKLKIEGRKVKILEGGS